MSLTPCQCMKQFEAHLCITPSSPVLHKTDSSCLSQFYSFLCVLILLKPLLSVLCCWSYPSAWFSSVTQSCPTLCDPMDCSMPGFPVHYQLLKLAQAHVHRVSDATQPSHPLSSPSPPAFNISQIGIFSNESVLLIRWPKYWNFSLSISPSSEYPGLIFLRVW